MASLWAVFNSLITDDDVFGAIWLSCMLSVGATSFKFHGKEKISMGWGRWAGIFKTCCAHMAATMVGYRNGLGQQWVGHFSPWDFRQFFSEDEHSLVGEPWLLKAIKWVWLRPWTPQKMHQRIKLWFKFSVLALSRSGNTDQRRHPQPIEDFQQVAYGG